MNNLLDSHRCLTIELSEREGRIATRKGCCNETFFNGSEPRKPQSLKERKKIMWLGIVASMPMATMEEIAFS